VIYFIFKALEFVIRAINLYEKMINRQDVMIKLLSELRGADRLEKKAADNQINETIVEHVEDSRPKEEPTTEFQLIDQIKKFYISKDYKNCKDYISKLIELYPNSGYVTFAKKKYDDIKDL
jgi:hypothetical protein